ncbi:WD repeat domain-containing protein 83 isoform X1 [Mycteria americana]|uniref:WD repeat domain-containing protein 83 isoform X1 n=1 Tax=Mycteria americana TaxID=33587 RepID=UPI003F584414
MAFPRPRPARPELPRRRVRTLECGQGAVRAVRFNVDGNYCLTCGSDKTLKLWNPHKGTALRTYQGHGYEVLDATGSFDNSQLCSCGADKTVVLWDVATGQVVRKYRGHAGKVNCVQFNEEATIIVSGSIDSTVRCWDCRSRRPDPVQVLDEAKDGVSSVKVSDHEILSGSVDGRVRRYDLRAGQLYSDYVGTSASARTGSAPWPPASTPLCACWTRRRGSCWASTSPLPVALCPPGGAVGGAPASPRPPGTPPHRYTGHRSTAYRLDCVLSEQDTHVGSASEDGNVYFWDLVEGSLALSLAVGRGVVQSLSFHPTLPCLLTATEGHVQLWREDTFQPEGDAAT